MDQRITVKVGGREYAINAPNPESEEIIRLAAKDLNSKISAFQTKFPGKNMVDIISFVALNTGISNISLRRTIVQSQEETAKLHKETENYLDRIK